MALVILIGASGAGKTTIAQAFAARYPTRRKSSFSIRSACPHANG
jgi:adenylate kinase family enzyme